MIDITELFKKWALTFILIINLLCATYADSREVIGFNKDWFFINPYKPWLEGRLLKTDDEKVILPHDWSINGPFDKNNPSGFSGGYLPGGKALYQKEFTVPKEWSEKKVIIEFDGVYQNSEVFVNGVLVGTRPNGWVSFYYDITKWLKFGEENFISVRVTNLDLPNCRWYSGSGIYRPVRLIIYEPLHIKIWGNFVSTPIVDKILSVVSIATTIKNETDKAKFFKITNQIYNQKGEKVAERSTDYSLSSNNEAVYNQQLSVQNPVLWSVDKPELYTVKTTILNDGKTYDEQTTTFGIREIRFDKDKGFFLNGKNLKLKGVCLHHDGGMVGAAVPPMVWERRLNLLKQMGCNAIRTSHNPFDPAFYNLCDQMGFLVLNESFDEWTVNKLDNVPNGYHKYWDKWHVQDLRDFLRRDRNHPSVIMWSLGNEIIEQAFPNGKDIARELVNICHEEDPTRSVTCGNNKHREANLTGFADEFDVVGYNYGHQFSMYEPDKKAYPNRKMIGTENTRGNSTRGYYAFPVPDNHKMIRTKNQYFSSYDGFSRIYGQENEWKVTKELDYVSGMFIWTGIDYIGETSWDWPTKYSDFGVIDACGFPKDAFYFYKSVWNENEITLHILPHWNWEGREGKITPVWCYTNCDEVELFLNSKSMGKRTFANSDLLNLEWNETKYEKGTLKAIGYKKGKKIAETQVQTTGEAKSFVIEADKKTIKANDQDVVHFVVSTKDANGLYVPNANQTFNVDIKGGKLLGIDSGDPQFVGSYKETKQRNLFNGLALIIVQATDKPEEIILTVKADNMEEAQAEVNVKSN